MKVMWPDEEASGIKPFSQLLADKLQMQQAVHLFLQAPMGRGSLYM